MHDDVVTPNESCRRDRDVELGVRIAIGTDAGTPGNHHGLNAHECVLMVTHCGLSAADSIRTATINAAQALGLGDELGTIEAGKRADLIFVGADPLQDITNARDVRRVMRGGRIYAIADLLPR